MFTDTSIILKVFILMDECKNVLSALMQKYL